MSNIEERVVKMKFDNAEFEKGTKATIASLDTLNKGLKLEGATKGLKDVAEMAKNFSIAHIASGVDALADKFRTLSIVGITALTNIVNRAVDAGISVAKSLTIDPIKQGLAEYENKLTSIKTILANTAKQGTTLGQVTEALDKLNHYSDQTIYSFGEMTNSVKMFTTAGVSLDTAVASIKGLSNVAAVTGTNSTDAARAMYQMSLALSSGSVRLQDWMSLESAGGMAGKIFQDSLIETAKVHGVNVDSMIKKNGSFRNSLQEGWLTTQVLTETVSKFTGDLTDKQLKAIGYTDKQIVEIQKLAKSALSSAQDVKTLTSLFDTLKEASGSGWAQTWEILFGNVDEATKLWSGLSNVVGGLINGASESRNKLLTDWKELGGRTAIIDAVSNAFHALITILQPIKEAFQEIFPPVTAKRLYDLSVSLRDFTSHLKIGEETAGKLKRTFAGVFAVFGIAIDIISGVAKVLFGLIGLVGKGSGGFLSLTARIGDFLVNLRASIKDGEGLKKFFQDLTDNLKSPSKLLKAIATYVKGLFDGFDPSAADGFISIFDKIGIAVKKAWNAIQPFLHDVGNGIAGAIKAIITALAKLDLNDILGIVGTGAGVGIAVMVGKLISSITGLFKGKEKGIFSTIKEAFNGLTDTLKSMQNTLRAATLIEIAIALGILTLSVIALSQIDSEGLTRALTAMTVMFAQLGGSLLAFEKFLGVKDVGKMIGLAAAMIVLGFAIRVLASSVKELSGMNWDELSKGLIGLAGVLGIVTTAVTFLPDDKKLISSGIGIVILAGAIKLLVSSVTDLSGLSWDEMARGLSGVAGLLLALGLFTKFGEVDKGGIGSGLGILLLAVGIKILADAMATIGNLSWEQVAKGLVGIAAGLAIVVGSMALVPPISFLSGAGFLIISLGLVSMADSLKKLGSMSWIEIVKGIVTMTVALALIAAALYIVPPTAPLAAAGILLVAMSLADIGDFLQKMSKLSWEEIGKAVLVLAASLAIIAGALLIMSGSLGGAVALVVVSGALIILTGVLTTLGALSWDAIIKGLVTLAAVFLVLGAAGLVLTPTVPTLLGLGLAIVLIGGGLALAGAGVFLFAAGLTALSVAGIAGSAAITDLGTAVINLIPLLATKLVEAFGILLAGVEEYSPRIVEVAIGILILIIDGIAKISPKLIDLFSLLLDIILKTLVDSVPKMVNAGLDILLGVLRGIANHIHDVVVAATDVIVNFIKGISDSLPKIIQAGFDLLLSFIRGITKAIDENSEEMGKAGGDLAVAIVKGMVKGIGGGVGEVTKAAKNLAKSALDAAKNFLGINSPSKEFEYVGIGTGEGYVVGVNKHIPKVVRATENMGSKALTALRDSLSGISDVVSGNMDLNPTITPVLDLTNIKKNADQIGALLATNPLSLNAAYSSASTVALDRQSQQSNDTTNSDTTPPQTPNVTYNQYNSSPKALSTTEIYRQTKNQISVTKKGVG